MSSAIERFAGRIIWGLGRKYGKYIPSFRNCWIFQILGQLTECYLYYFGNHFYDFRFNGEAEIVRNLTPPVGGVLLDVGGHHGSYAELLLRQCANSSIHVFEINPQNLAILKKKVGKKANIKIHPFGLGSKEKKATMIQYNQDGQVSSLHDLGTAAASKSFGCEIVTIRQGDDILAQENIHEIYFMKIDTEGHDFEVLKGFNNALNQKRIHIIQFEYNETSISARVFLKDYFDYLLPKQYKIGRVFPKKIEFTEYLTSYENHKGSNWLACADTAPGKIFLRSLSA